MDLIYIYAIAAGGTFFVAALVHLLPYISPLVTYVSVSISKHLTYPYLIERHRIVGPWTRAGVVMQLVYVAANLFCAGFGASTIADAGLRAGTLAVVNMIPLFAAPHFAFAADLIGMSLKTIRGIHRSAGFMVFLLGLLHVVTVVASNVSLHLDLTRDLFAVIVCVPPLICISLTDNGIGRVAPLSPPPARVSSFPKELL
jgi:hypothetical protein